MEVGTDKMSEESAFVKPVVPARWSQVCVQTEAAAQREA